MVQSIEIRVHDLDGGVQPHRSLSRAGGTALVEDDLPTTIGFSPPDRVEGADLLPVGVSYRTARQRERAGFEHFDRFGLPGKRRPRAVEKGLPTRGNRRLSAQDARIVKEQGLVGHKRRERVVIASGHRLRERRLRRAHLRGQRVTRLAVRALAQTAAWWQVRRGQSFWSRVPLGHEYRRFTSLCDAIIAACSHAVPRVVTVATVTGSSGILWPCWSGRAELVAPSCTQMEALEPAVDSRSTRRNRRDVARRGSGSVVRTQIGSGWQAVWRLHSGEPPVVNAHVNGDR